MGTHETDPPAEEGAQRAIPRIPRLLYAEGVVLWLALTAVLGIGAGTLTLSLDDDLRRRGG